MGPLEAKAEHCNRHVANISSACPKEDVQLEAALPSSSLKCGARYQLHHRHRAGGMFFASWLDLKVALLCIALGVAGPVHEMVHAVLDCSS